MFRTDKGEMRQQGTVTEWNDARGFGFITPGDGGARVFVHVSAFPRGRRPVTNDGVTYVLAQDSRNRLSASDVHYAVPARVGLRTPRGLVAALAVAAVFAGLVVTLVVADRIPALFLAGYVVLSLVAFGMYRADKTAAVQGAWRIPEVNLHVVGLVGGWPGGLVARRLLRHKTRKQPFRTFFWGTVIANCAALAWLAYDMPSWLG